MYLAFLDEFGHIGPFIRRSHLRFNSSPVFGLAGYVMPHENVRSFATWFYQFKCNLLASELKASGKHPATWEKKGTELFTTKNIRKYPSLASAANRLVNQIYKRDGKLFYHGRQKYQKPHQSNSSGLYATVLSRSMRDIDRFCGQKPDHFMMILDQHEDRLMLLEAAAKTMFGNQPTRHLIEPPLQVESHLYQTIQAADWIATLTGRLLAHRIEPQQYADWEWTERLVGTKIDAYSTHSSLWRPTATKVTPGATVPATAVIETNVVVSMTKTTVVKK